MPKTIRNGTFDKKMNYEKESSSVISNMIYSCKSYGDQVMMGHSELNNILDTNASYVDTFNMVKMTDSIEKQNCKNPYIILNSDSGITEFVGNKKNEIEEYELTFKGTFEKSERTGRFYENGLCTFEGTIENGSIKEGNFSGYGIKYDKNEKPIYEGNFENSERKGKGKWHWYKPNRTIEGTFDNGEIRDATIIDEDVVTFKGHIKLDGDIISEKTGIGYYSKNGEERFIGIMKNEKLHTGFEFTAQKKVTYKQSGKEIYNFEIQNDEKLTIDQNHKYPTNQLTLNGEIGYISNKCKSDNSIELLDYPFSDFKKFRLQK